MESARRTDHRQDMRRTGRGDRRSRDEKSKAARQDGR